MSDTLMMIPLCRLKPSKLNIRKTEPLADIEQLAASIASKGVLENLVVRPASDGNDAEHARFEVTAGRRRYAALRLLARRKKLARDFPVPCLVRGAEGAADAVEVSLAENIVRVPIHPADQFEAFARLQKEGLPAEDIAARFGLSAQIVLQRLKLAAVSPRLLAAYRAGDMTLEQLMAFTIADDHAAQEAVWFDSPYGPPAPSTIRRLLTSSHVEGRDRRARFIGATAYEEAGGTILRDLFDAEGSGYFADSQLLDRLVAARLEEEADRIRAEGWGWVEIRPETDYAHLGRFARLKTVEVALGEDEEARLAKLAARYDTLVASLEEQEDPETAAELDSVSAEIDALQAKKEVWPEAEKAPAGAVLSLSADGSLHVARGLIRHAPNEPARARAERDERVDESHGETPSGTGYSEALLFELSAHRTAVLRELVAGDPVIALRALLHVLAARLLYASHDDSCVEIVARTTDLASISESVGQSKAAEALHARLERWSGRMPEREHLWDWIAARSGDEQLELLAYLVALTVDAVEARGASAARRADADRLAAVLQLDMAPWWRPTAEGFFARLTKRQILAAVAEGISPEAAKRLESLKKNEMSERAEALLAPTAWLPAALRRTSLDSEKGTETRASTEA